MSKFDKENVLRLLDEVELVPADGPGPFGWVYFLTCEATDRCKIGFTKGDPQKRVASLQTGSAHQLAMIAKHPGTPSTERRLHERFASSRLHGEWFEITDELRAYMVWTLWLMSEFTINQGQRLEPWQYVGLDLTLKSLGCVSETLIEALEKDPA